MIRTVFALAATLAFAAPAFAQSGSTQSPPAPNASSSAPTPATSAPAGAMTMSPSSPANPNVSAPVGGTTTTAPAAGAPSSAMQRTVPTPTSK